MRFWGVVMSPRVLRSGLKTGLLCLFLLAAGGCGGAMGGWSSDSFSRENKISKVAVLVESESVYMGIQGKYIFDLESSRRLMDMYLPSIKPAMEDKGYQVVYIQPAGYAFMGRRSYTSFEDVVAYQDLQAEPPVPLPLARDRFAQQAEALQQNPALGRAVSSIYAQYFNAGSQGQGIDFRLSPEDVAVVRQVTGSDTICLALFGAYSRTSGQKGSRALAGGTSAAVAGAAAAGPVGLAIAAPLGLLGSLAPDREGISFVFVDGQSGEALWTYRESFVRGNSTPRQVLDTALSGFPKKP